MSTLQETVKTTAVDLPRKRKIKESLASRFLSLLCSVRFGVFMLILLGLACLIGMLVMQQNLDGFEQYYGALTPAEQLVFKSLGFFDIYHSWYFNAILAVLSLNIILASIDRLPKTWAFVSKPVLTPPLRWLKEQKLAADFRIEGESKEAVAAKIAGLFEKSGWRRPAISEKNGRTFIFTQSGTWNRFAYLAVHVGLLTIFIGGFLTSQIGQTGNMPLTPGQTSDLIYDTAFNLDQLEQITKRIPFEVTCTDIQQKLIKKDGSISAGNTIDWLTRIRIKDGAESHDAVVQMNRPYDYRGYRFFQASFVSIGRARNITLRLTGADGSAQDITIQRDGSAQLPDGTNIRFVDFRGNFSLSKENPDEDTSNYPNPAAILQVTPSGGQAQTAYAFGESMAKMPVADKAIAGYKFQLLDFEKVSDQHILSVQRDPGANVVYLGFLLLSLTLVLVFFFSHRRIWAAIEESPDKGYLVSLGGNTNRNQAGFEAKFKQIVAGLRSL